MIEGLRPYPEMQSTGHPGLPSIPVHWDVRRNGRLFSERRETGFPDLPILEVSLRSGVRIRDMEGGKRKQQIVDRSVYQRAIKGDIAYNMMRMWQGAVGIAPADGLVSPAYVVATAHEGVDAAYYAYLFRTDDYMKEIDSYSRGIVPDRNRLYWQAFKQMPSAYPPLEEQRLIVRFLDWHGAMTGKLIRAKRRLIALLNEQKQSIIHRAVTRGLDPAAKLKPSGIDWLGDVPEHWEVKPLKHVVSRIVGGSTPKSGEPEYWDGDVIWVTPSDISRKERLDTSLRKITEAGLASCGASYVPAGSIIVTSRAPVGNVAIAQVSLSTNQGCKALIPDPNQVETNFAFHLLKVLKAELVSLATGTTFAEISSSRLGAVRVPLPPLTEQSDILTAVERSTAELTNAIEAAQAEISFIQEFRTRLIADVVTGQLDARAVAANLPQVSQADGAGDLTDEDDLDDDADDLTDEDEAA